MKPDQVIGHARGLLIPLSPVGEFDEERKDATLVAVDRKLI